jgi:hypothetical protein
MNTTHTLLFLPVLALIGCQSPSADSETRPPGTNLLSRSAMNEALTGEPDFVRHVAPILRERCLYCHEPTSMPGHLSLASREEAMTTGPASPAIIPGKPAASPLIRSLKGAHPKTAAMPAVGDQVTSEEVRVLERWIASGAPWPSGDAGRLR